PVRTMRIFSSAENRRWVTRRIFFTTCPAGSFPGPDFCPICAPSMAMMGQKSFLPQPASLIGADAGQSSVEGESCHSFPSIDRLSYHTRELTEAEAKPPTRKQKRTLERQ